MEKKTNKVSQSDCFLIIFLLPFLLVYWFGFCILYIQLRVNWWINKINEENL